MRERGERLAEFGGRPQQEAFELLAVGVEGRLRVDETREPRLDVNRNNFIKSNFMAVPANRDCTDRD